jgi:hypothetical protein
MTNAPRLYKHKPVNPYRYLTAAAKCAGVKLPCKPVDDISEMFCLATFSHRLSPSMVGVGATTVLKHRIFTHRLRVWLESIADDPKNWLDRMGWGSLKDAVALMAWSYPVGVAVMLSRG